VKSLLFKIVGVLLSFLVAFAIAEGSVRLFRPQEVGPVRFACDPALGEIPVPGQHGERHFPGVFDFTYSNNSLGWRGPREYQKDKRTRYRVLFLGDSFTYGLGVNDDQPFPAQVEKILTSDGVSVETMNAGCPGKGTDYEVKVFDTVGLKFHPDLTVLCFFCNDFQDNERGEYYNIGKHGELQAKKLNCSQGTLKKTLLDLPGYNWLISWSQAANLVKQAGVDVLVNRAGKTGSDATAGLVVSYHRGVEGFANRANKSLTNLYVEHLNTAVEHAGGSLIMFYIPIAQEVREYQENRTISADEQACVRIAADNGITLWSLTPLLALSGQTIVNLYYKEGHWTAAAHEMAARYMSRCIARRLTEGRQAVRPEPIN
jgi:hypothetical protein